MLSLVHVAFLLITNEYEREEGFQKVERVQMRGRKMESGVYRSLS